MIKAVPNDYESMDVLFDNYGYYVLKVLRDIEKIYNSYEKIEPKEGQCSICNEEKTLAYGIVKKKKAEKICYNCFTKQWSEYTLFKDYKENLIKLSKQDTPYFPYLSIHRGYYYGVISTAVKIFKSYIKKKNDRDFQILRAKDKCLEIQGKIDSFGFDIKDTRREIKNGKNLTDELNRMLKGRKALKGDLKQYKKLSKRKGVNFPKFNSNEIYFGKQGMFKFENEYGKYFLGISDYKRLRNKLGFKLKIGDYQKEFIDKCIEKKQHKIVYPKIIRRRIISDAKAKKQDKSAYEYYFIFPTRDVCDVKILKGDVEDYIKKNKDLVICSLSFGIKKPVNMVAFKDGKIIDVKTFGNGSLYHKCELERNLRGKIYDTISERYKHEYPHLTDKDKSLHRKKRKALKKINMKLGFRNLRFVNYFNQNLTRQVINYISKYKKSVIVIRDTKGIKNISYLGEYAKRLSRWSIEQQKTFLIYKSYLNNIPIYKIPYSDSNLTKCSRCGDITKEKVTTEKLNFENRFKCKCGYSENFYKNDAINLLSSIKDIQAGQAPP